MGIPSGPDHTESKVHFCQRGGQHSCHHIVRRVSMSCTDFIKTLRFAYAQKRNQKRCKRGVKGPENWSPTDCYIVSGRFVLKHLIKFAIKSSVLPIYLYVCSSVCLSVCRMEELGSGVGVIKSAKNIEVWLNSETLTCTYYWDRSTFMMIFHWNIFGMNKQKLKHRKHFLQMYFFLNLPFDRHLQNGAQ
jgi:hypothetical protein